MLQLLSCLAKWAVWLWPSRPGILACPRCPLVRGWKKSTDRYKTLNKTQTHTHTQSSGLLDNAFDVDQFESGLVKVEVYANGRIVFDAFFRHYSSEGHPLGSFCTDVARLESGSVPLRNNQMSPINPHMAQRLDIKQPYSNMLVSWAWSASGMFGRTSGKPELILTFTFFSQMSAEN